METKGSAISGLGARPYNFQNFLNGASFVYSKITMLIELKRGKKVLDIGCGTGTLLFRLRQRYGSGVLLCGIDPSEDMISIAQKRNKKLQSQINFQLGVGEAIPFKNNSFDVVLSSLAMHHLPLETKAQVAREARRVLKPDGRLLITDFGKPGSLLGRVIMFIIQKHSFVKDNIGGAVTRILKEAGFRGVHVICTQFGSIEHIMAVK